MRQTDTWQLLSRANERAILELTKPENNDAAEPGRGPGKQEENSEEDTAAEFKRIQARLRLLIEAVVKGHWNLRK